MGDTYEREQRNQEATVHVGNLDSLATEELVWELFSQAGPLERIHIPRDKVTGEGSGYGFVEFALERDAEYGTKLLNGVKLYNRPLRVNRATATSKAQDVGANLFVGGLDEQVDEAMLTEVFSAFGHLIRAPQVARDLATAKSLGYAFLAYDNFTSSDNAIASMNDQFLYNKQIRVMYAYKKGTTERHGTDIERLLAAGHVVGLPDDLPSSITGANSIPVGRPQIMGFAPPPPPLMPSSIGGMPFMPPPPPPPPLMSSFPR